MLTSRLRLLQWGSTRADERDEMNEMGRVTVSTLLVPATLEAPMLTLDSLKTDIETRLTQVPTKKHVSVRWEPGPGICRVGVCIHDYTWDTRDEVIDHLLAFEEAHHGEVAVEFDIFALDDVNTAGFAEV